MRSFQMMRCGRRPLTSTGSELNESILHPNETASVSRHRNTMSTSNNSSRQNSFQYDEDEDVSIQSTVYAKYFMYRIFLYLAECIKCAKMCAQS
ncbi:hypothetical protein I4U23_018149 [Adineta vaga]|nr:hypothetical protein I4U23_018149 [Adineta vaga]